MTTAPHKAAEPETPVSCFFCGTPERLELAELWTDHVWWPETCCEALHHHVLEGISDDPMWGRTLLDRLLARAGQAHHGPLRRLAPDSHRGLLLDWHPRVGAIPLTQAAAFVRRHHAHLGPPPAARFTLAATNGPTLAGVAIVGNPLSRALHAQGALEVTRLCTRRDIAPALRWNIASMLLGAAAREAARRGATRLVTYIRDDEAGASLRAAGFTQVATVRGRSWHRPGRARATSANTWIDKTRWERSLPPPKPRPALTRIARDTSRTEAFTGGLPCAF
jgi:hypothetical protein